MPLNKKLVIVSGLAGSGKTVVIHALEDVGYYCIDNLPAVLLESFDKEILLGIHAENIALALDSRDEDVPKTLQRIFNHLKELCQVSVLYLEASSDILVRRFRETRRQHPITVQHPLLGLVESIALDEKTLDPIKNLASRVLNTSQMPVQVLKQFIHNHYSPSITSHHLLISFVSFGFKHGVPSDLDTMFDVRCFRNPYYDLSLRSQTGLNQAVKNYVLEDPNIHSFMHKIITLIEFLYPLYQEEGKRYLSIGIGCTGGKHRSVTIVEELLRHFSSVFPHVIAEHRHLSKD